MLRKCFVGYENYIFGWTVSLSAKIRGTFCFSEGNIAEFYPVTSCSFSLTWSKKKFPLFCLCFQLVSIITDETPIEQMRNRLMIKDRGSSSSSSSTTTSSSSSSQLPHHPPHTRKPKLALLREVFGRGGLLFVIFHRIIHHISGLKWVL